MSRADRACHLMMMGEVGKASSSNSVVVVVKHSLTHITHIFLY